MAKTLLNGVNEVLKLTNIVKGDSGILTGLTDSARQNYIDTAVQVWNQLIDQLFTESEEPLPNQQSSNTITLVTGTQSYAMQSDVVRLRFPLINRADGHEIWEMEYNSILRNDPEQDDTGEPLYAAVSPVDGQLYFDRTPTATENGDVYTYQYDKDTELTLAADVMPFTDAVFRAMVPAVAELWKKERQRPFDAGILALHYARAGRLLKGVTPRTSYNPRG